MKLSRSASLGPAGSLAGLLLLLLAAVSQVAAASEAAPSNAYWTAYFDPATNLYSVAPIYDPVNGVATGEFGDERNSSGWARLTVKTNPVYADELTMWGAGYLEGRVTAAMVWENWYNLLQSSFGGSVPAALQGWFKANLAWMDDQVRRYAATQPYWRHVELLLLQLRGIHQGYQESAFVANSTARALPFDAFILLNSDGDMEELCVVANCPSIPGLGQRTKKPPIQNTHCSAYVRVTPDLQELYAGHTTWADYYNMVRVFKHYDFPLRAAQTTARTTLFSSYPAFVSSVDDFYQLSSGLVVIETTNGITNEALFKYIKPQSVMSWIRVSVANRMAGSGEEWIDIFKQYNSGTYNNQWIIVNYARFTPGEPLPDGVLHVVEQIPTRVEFEDVTHYLRLGYWPSYNIPYFESIYNESGFIELERTYGDWFNYQMHPRAYIFRRDAVKVNDLAAARNLLRYNDWQNDPAAYGNPGNQISSRFDLVPKGDNPPNPNLVRAAFGGIDSKITSKALVRLGRCQAQSGPSHDQQPPFEWNDADWPHTTHIGQPKVWNFGWFEMPSGNAV